MLLTNSTKGKNIGLIWRSVTENGQAVKPLKLVESNWSFLAPSVGKLHQGRLLHGLELQPHHCCSARTHLHSEVELRRSVNNRMFFFLWSRPAVRSSTHPPAQPPGSSSFTRYAAATARRLLIAACRPHGLPGSPLACVADRSRLGNCSALALTQQVEPCLSK